MAMRKRTETVSRLDAIRKVADRFEAFRPAGEVLTKVKAVPTIFPQLNRAVKIGGWPLQRIAVIHGPSNHGKTMLAHGLGLSFLQADHFYHFVDAEYTTPQPWLQTLMGQHAEHPGFRALRPRSYEETVVGVRKSAEVISKAKQDGELPEDVGCLVVVDSIRKLVPERLLEKIAKEEGGTDGANGLGAMYKAALNAQWLDELAPLAYHANLSIVLITRETENVGAKAFEEQFKIGGGKALIYESSLQLRVVRAGWIREGSGDNAEVIGERHLVQIRKTKVSVQEEKTIDFDFYSSNGKSSAPEGFDRVRDVFEMARELKIIVQKGSHFHWNGEAIGQGASKACDWLRANPDAIAKLEQLCQRGEGEV